MVSNPNVSLALRVRLTLSTPTLALSFTAAALPAAPAPFAHVFTDSSCDFLSFSLPVSPRTCCSSGCPQGWEHGQVTQQRQLSSAVYGDWGFNTRAGREPLSGNFQSHNLIWSIFWEYTGVCCWVSFMHPGKSGVVPRNGQCVCLVCWWKMSYSSPGVRALGQGALKVTWVTLSPELAHGESSLLSSNSWAVYSTVSILHKPWNGLQPLEQSISC